MKNMNMNAPKPHMYLLSELQVRTRNNRPLMNMSIHEHIHRRIIGWTTPLNDLQTNQLTKHQMHQRTYK